MTAFNKTPGAVNLGSLRGADLTAHAVMMSEHVEAPVFPVMVFPDPKQQGKWIKHPLVKEWQNGGAATHPEAIEEMFSRCPAATHVGLQTGEQSRLLVIDLDGEPGLKWWREHPELLPATRTQATMREGGRHLLYRMPRGCGLRNSAGKIAPGVDVRAGGGFIVDWSPLHAPEVEELTDAPGELIDFLQRETAKPSAPLQSLRDSANASQKVPETKRHATLKSIAASLRRKGLKDSVLEAALLAWNDAHCEPPQERKDVVTLARDFSLKEGGDLLPDSHADWTPPAVASYGETFDAAAIALREWIIEGRYARGEGTAIAGPPGTNKSTLMLTDAVQIVTGRSVLGERIKLRGGVLFLVGEDRRRDFEARLAGICAHYRIQPRELGGRLHVVYQSEIDPTGYSLGQMSDDMATLNTRMFLWLQAFPDLVALFIDPMLSWHRLIENDTGAMSMLCVALRGLASQSNICVCFDHHVTKASQFDCEAHVGNLSAMRGSSAIAADMRWAFTMAKLKAETAGQYGIAEEDRRVYRRLDSLKASYGPESDGPQLLKIQSVRIANGEWVGVLTAVDSGRLRADGIERAESAQADRRSRLGEALARMLRESAPRSASEAALWIATHEPALYPGKRGAPLCDRTIRNRLPAEIGNGLDVLSGGRQERIVFRVSGKGTGVRVEIDLQQRAAL
jgi:RecA-family ATPase